MARQGKKSAWKLVEIEPCPLHSGVIEARRRWQGKQVWTLTPWLQWRRGKVLVITDDGLVVVKVYQKGTLGIGIQFRVEGVSEILRYVNE